MSRHNFSWRIAITFSSVLYILASHSPVAFGQYTFVQDTDSFGDWIDVLNWDTDNDPNTPNASYPNAVGATALLIEPIKSGVGAYTLQMPTTDVTVGQITIDNTTNNYMYSTQTILESGTGGRLIFEDSSGTAKYIETLNTNTAPQNIQNSIRPLILLNSDLEITQNNYLNLNTGTIFTNRIDGAANRKIIKKGAGGIQFNLNVAPPLPAGQGFLGQIEIQEGAIRLINRTTFLSTVSGITVSPGGQLQLADNASTAVPDYNMAPGAVLNINGSGTLATTTSTEGALRFGTSVVTGQPRTVTFHNPVVLQGDSVISAGGATNTGVLEKPVTGAFSLTKHGDGKLVILDPLSGWGGDTHILTAPTTGGNSVLSLPGTILADGKDVYLSVTRSAIDLNFSGVDTIRQLFLDGTPQAVGIYGKVGSADPTDIEVAWITGNGQLNVTGLPVVGVPGDFNDNGTVDAGDYVLWRKGGPLANQVDDPNTVNGQDYLDWRARFGNPPGSGSGLGATAIPEPATFVLFMLIAPFFLGLIRGRTRS